jgi:hypothetical protein
MTLNPIHDYLTQQLLSKYRVRVTLIYDWSHDCDFAEFHTIKTYCKDNGMIFGSREYNTYRYYQDREFVVKLPAFHVFVQDDYERTLYPGPDIFNDFQAIILGIKIKEAAKKQVKDERRKRFEGLWLFLGSLVSRRKTLPDLDFQRRLSQRRTSLIETKN